jgi:hypothetical protein
MPSSRNASECAARAAGVEVWRVVVGVSLVVAVPSPWRRLRPPRLRRRRVAGAVPSDGATVAAWTVALAAGCRWAVGGSATAVAAAELKAEGDASASWGVFDFLRKKSRGSDPFDCLPGGPVPAAVARARLSVGRAGRWVAGGVRALGRGDEAAQKRSDRRVDAACHKQLNVRIARIMKRVDKGLRDSPAAGSRWSAVGSRQSAIGGWRSAVGARTAGDSQPHPRRAASAGPRRMPTPP